MPPNIRPAKQINSRRFVAARKEDILGHNNIAFD